MTVNARYTRLLGALLLAALITNGIGSEIAESTTDSGIMRAGELIELLCSAALVGAGAAAYVLFRERSPGMAAAHLGFRITEAAVNMMIVLTTFTAAGLTGPLRDLLLEQRYQAQLIAIYAYAFSGVIMYLLLHRHRVVPRFLTIWGLAGVAVLLVGSLFDLFGADLDMLVYAAPLGVNELLLALWLVFLPTRRRSQISAPAVAV